MLIPFDINLLFLQKNKQEINYAWISKDLRQSCKNKRQLRYQYYKNKNKTRTKYIAYSKLLQKYINNAKRYANIKYINNNNNKCKATYSMIKIKFTIQIKKKQY